MPSAEAYPRSNDVKALRQTYMVYVCVAVPGPPFVKAKGMSITFHASIIRRRMVIPRMGRSSGSVM